MNIEQFESPPPGILPGDNKGITSANYRVRYYTANLSDLEQITMLEDILTRSLDGKNIVVIDKDKYSFQNNYFVVVTYLEKR